MRKAGKIYNTFNKIRLALFIHSYAHHYISRYVKTKYKINEQLVLKELRKKYFSKHTIPEISRLSKALNFNYKLLWQSIIINKNYAISKNVKNKEKIEI